MYTHIILVSLLLSCLASFTWAARKFFVQPDRPTAGMRLTVFASIASAVANFVVILRTRELLPPLVIAAAVLYCLSFGIFWWAIAANRSKPLAACFSESDQPNLVQHGPYRFVRHPFYCAYLLSWLAGAVGTKSIVLYGASAAMFALYSTVATNEEERFANSTMADEYRRYAEKTGCFLPKIF